VLDWVVSDQCDLGFAAAPIEHAAARSEMMPAVRYVAVMPDGHRLARRRVLRPRDFAGQPFVTLGPTTPSRHRIDDVFAQHGVSRVLRVETPLSEIACALVAAGVGLSVCVRSPLRSIRPEASSSVRSSRRSRFRSPHSIRRIARSRRSRASSSPALRDTSRHPARSRGRHPHVSRSSLGRLGLAVEPAAGDRAASLARPGWKIEVVVTAAVK
jgi:DNA-binding transcriptional LysR family regulator